MFFEASLDNYSIVRCVTHFEVQNLSAQIRSISVIRVPIKKIHH
jgi:hypothetical protein